MCTKNRTHQEVLVGVVVDWLEEWRALSTDTQNCSCGGREGGREGGGREGGDRGTEGGMVIVE